MTDLRQAQLELAQSQAGLEAVLQAGNREAALAPAPAEDCQVPGASGADPAGGGDATTSPAPAAPAPKESKGARGVDTLFRSAYRVQMDLTALADNKANMMVSINGIIMSIIIASIAPKLDSNPWLLLPTAVLLVGSMVSIIYAILAARPRVSHDYVSLADLRHSKGNILFFGNFANMPQDEFVHGMEEMLEEKGLLFETMIRNIHSLGCVLNKKFGLLQVAYTAFMIALCAGVFSFLGVFVWVLLMQG